jgi:hypothetical protein
VVSEFIELRSPKMPISAAELKNLDKNITRLKEQLANNNVKMTFSPCLSFILNNN